MQTRSQVILSISSHDCCQTHLRQCRHTIVRWRQLLQFSWHGRRFFLHDRVGRLPAPKPTVLGSGSKLKPHLIPCELLSEADVCESHLANPTMAENFEATWVDAADGSIPENAVEGGQDTGGETIYVGRASFEEAGEGCILPGKVVPSHGVCYVPWDHREHPVSTYQVLVQPADGTVTLEWVPGAGNEVVPGAIVGGVNAEQENLYVGRGVYEDADVVGKVLVSHGFCFVPYDGRAIPLDTYEVLVAKPQ